VSEFVQECRREWRRLGVPDAAAEEMASELTADLADAEAEGLSAEGYLGASASDPQSFAASWARERGVLPTAEEAGVRRRPAALVMFTALAVATVAVAALLLITGEPKVSLTTTRTSPLHLPALPSGPSRPTIIGPVVRTSAAAPVEWILLFVALAALAFAAWLWTRWNRSRPRITAPRGPALS
jgi:hypothetical protein